MFDFSAHVQFIDYNMTTQRMLSSIWLPGSTTDAWDGAMVKALNLVLDGIDSLPAAVYADLLVRFIMESR